MNLGILICFMVSLMDEPLTAESCKDSTTWTSLAEQPLEEEEQQHEQQQQMQPLLRTSWTPELIYGSGCKT
jgi:hypothetical protein